MKATAVLEETDGEGGVGVSGYAREQLERKKSDDSQLTGAASTYARKRALEGLFLLDDSGDVTDPDEYEEDPEEELDKQEAEEQEEAPVERKPRSRRKKKKEEDFMNIPEGVDEEVPFTTEKELSKEELEEHMDKVFGGPFDPETGLPTMEDEEDDKLTKDTCFKVLQADGKYNYIKLHPGDEVPEGSVEITEKEFGEGVTRIAQGKEEPEQKPITRRARKRRN